MRYVVETNCHAMIPTWFTLTVVSRVVTQFTDLI